MMEFDRSPNPLRESITKNKIVQENSRIHVPTEAGLGIEVDENLIREIAKETADS
jgi:L-alanine-DL-glutamate epimerase-like enolase superfamily enzyme